VNTALPKTARILIIAGSDSGGGAGIQADIKTVTMLGGHAMTAITAITAQNTMRVDAVHLVPVEMVLAQIDAVVGDIGVDAIKIGMLGSPAIALALAERLKAFASLPIVFDPVMIASSGAALAGAETVAAFATLMDLATLVTPNLPELAALGGSAEDLAARHGCAVLVKGGHGTGERLADRLIRDGADPVEWQADRIATRHDHGTGCTLASAIATGLGQGLTIETAIERGRAFVRAALAAAPGLGAGHGPMGHGLIGIGT
jgi:hydroxymethylpyrimidine/phosphomethylpyrimidine kinase